MRKLTLSLVILALMLPLAAFGQTAQQLNYTLTADIVGGPEDGIAGSQEFNIGPTTEVDVFVLDLTGDGLVDTIRILQPDQEAGSSFSFEFSTRWMDYPLDVGSFPEAQWVAGKVAGNYMFVTTPATDMGVCDSGIGDFTVAQAEFEKFTPEEGDEFWVARKFLASFEAKCEWVDGKARGSVNVELADTPGGGGGGSEPPPPPPPTYVAIVTPASNVFLGDDDSATIAIGTVPQQGYEGPIYLEAFGPPGLTVTFDPQMIPAPGSGTSAMTIETSEWLIPMRHLVEIRASGPPRATSRVIAVEMACEPPFVRALDVDTSVIVQPGESTTIEVPVVGSGPLHYQWYEGPRGSTWRPIEGADGPELTVGPVNGTNHYWLRVYNGCGTWDSPTIRVGNTPARSRPVR